MSIVVAAAPALGQNRISRPLDLEPVGTMGFVGGPSGPAGAAVNSSGDAVLARGWPAGSGYVPQVSERSGRRGTWSRWRSLPVHRLRIDEAEHIQVAVNGRGEAAVMFLAKSLTTYVVRRGVDRRWRAPISVPGDPDHVAIDDAGTVRAIAMTGVRGSSCDLSSVDGCWMTLAVLQARPTDNAFAAAASLEIHTNGVPWMTVNAAGDAVVTWTGLTADGRRVMFASRRRAAEPGFEAPRVVVDLGATGDTAPGHGLTVMVAIGSAGDAAIAWWLTSDPWYDDRSLEPVYPPDGRVINIIRRPVSGDWGAAEQVGVPDLPVMIGLDDLSVGPDGTTAVLWSGVIPGSAAAPAVYVSRRRPSDDAWTTSPNLLRIVSAGGEPTPGQPSVTVTAAAVLALVPTTPGRMGLATMPSGPGATALVLVEPDARLATAPDGTALTVAGPVTLRDFDAAPPRPPAPIAKVLSVRQSQGAVMVRVRTNRPGTVGVALGPVDFTGIWERYTEIGVRRAGVHTILIPKEHWKGLHRLRAYVCNRRTGCSRTPLRRIVLS